MRYVRSKAGTWHLLIEDYNGAAITDCGLLLKDPRPADMLPAKQPARRVCLQCHWLKHGRIPTWQKHLADAAPDRYEYVGPAL